MMTKEMRFSMEEDSLLENLLLFVEDLLADYYLRNHLPSVEVDKSTEKQRRKEVLAEAASVAMSTAAAAVVMTLNMELDNSQNNETKMDSFANT